MTTRKQGTVDPLTPASGSLHPCKGIEFPRSAISFNSFHLWSTLRLVPSSKDDSGRLFTASLGQYGQGFGHGHALSSGDTNLREVGRVPVGKPASIKLVAWNIIGCSKDQEHLYLTGSLSWDFISTFLPISPLSAALVSEDGSILERRNEIEGIWGSCPVNLSLSSSDTFAVLARWGGGHKFRDECFLRVHLIGDHSPAVTVL
jgi:hypothetical protein